jgi:3'-5' exoribonuclease
MITDCLHMLSGHLAIRLPRIQFDSMAALNFTQLTPGDRVQHDLLVVDRLEKNTSAGDTYVVLTLGNASGKIDTAPIWSNQACWADGAERGRVVQAIGEVTTQDKSGQPTRQLQLTAPLRLVPNEQADPDEFLPRISGDTARLWEWIDKVRGDIQSATLRRIVDMFFDDDVFRLRFERTPGSPTGHHAKIGGLLLHVYEVTTIARTTARTTNANMDLVITGALLHDIGKVEAFEVTPFGFSFSPCGMLLGHVVTGCLMLERRLAKAGDPFCSEGQLLELQHLILSHHGSLEFGSPVRPMTLEAEIIHWADESSAKANDMMESLDDGDAFRSGSDFSDRSVWRVGRRVWRRPHGWE